MAGSRPVLVEQARDLNQELAWRFTPTAQRTVFWIPERKVVIDSITVSYSAAAGSARTGNIAYATSATISTNTDVTVTDGMDFNSTTETPITPSFCSEVSEATAADATHIPASNVIPASGRVMLELNGAVGSLAGVCIRMRVRTAIA